MLKKFPITLVTHTNDREYADWISHNIPSSEVILIRDENRYVIRVYLYSRIPLPKKFKYKLAGLYMKLVKNRYERFLKNRFKWRNENGQKSNNP